VPTEKGGQGDKDSLSIFQTSKAIPCRSVYGRTEHPNAAILHFQPLANDNDPSAQFALAMTHSGGFGNRQDKSYNPDRAIS
jgi:hypothetical protein